MPDAPTGARVSPEGFAAVAAALEDAHRLDFLSVFGVEWYESLRGEWRLKVCDGDGNDHFFTGATFREAIDAARADAARAGGGAA